MKRFFIFVVVFIICTLLVDGMDSLIGFKFNTDESGIVIIIHKFALMSYGAILVQMTKWLLKK